MKKNNKLLIIAILILVIVIAYIIYIVISKYMGDKLNTIDNANYTLQYDKSWKVSEQSEGNVILIHKKSKSQLNIQLLELDEDKQYKGIDEIFDDVLYNVQEQNKEYKLINQTKESFTQNNIEGYKVLFESPDNQAMLDFYKYGSRVIAYLYEASHEDFDIVLDSTNNIINNFKVKEQSFDVTSTIDLQTETVTYSDSPAIADALTDNTQTAQIADENYAVTYKLPEGLTQTDLDTTIDTFELEGLADKVQLQVSTSVVNRNLYDFFDKAGNYSIYDVFSKKDAAKYTTDKLGDNPLSYICKANYSDQYEEAVLVYELNVDHIFYVWIKAQNAMIPKKLVDMISLESYENYANNITLEKEGEYLIGTLQDNVDYKKEQIRKIKLKLPETYREIDDGLNLYDTRHYGLNYDSKKGGYQYEVIYGTTSMDIDSALKSVTTEANESNGNYRPFAQIQDITVNDRTFKAYDMTCAEYLDNYDENNNLYKANVHQVVLFYDLDDSKKLEIRIKGYDCNVTDDTIKSLLNFDILTK